MNRIAKRSHHFESVVHWLLLVYVLVCVFAGAGKPHPMAAILGYLLLPLFVLPILVAFGKLVPRLRR